MYFTRGAPVVYYGDEVGMIGSGGDQQARQDMFPTQVTDWQTQPRVGSPAIGTGSSFADTTNPIELLLPQLSQLRADNPALEYGATFIRYSHHGVLAMSRIDAAAKREYLVLTNSGTSGATITIPTSTPSSSWSVLFGGGSAQTTGASGKMTVTVPPIGAVVLEAANPIAVASPKKPLVKIRADLYTNFIAVNASVTGTQPFTIAFAVKRAHSSTWRRLDVDDSPPYRGFLDPTKYKKGEQLRLVAVARNLNGKTATSSGRHVPDATSLRSVAASARVATGPTQTSSPSNRSSHSASGRVANTAARSAASDSWSSA